MLTLAINTASSVTGIALIQGANSASSDELLIENSWPSQNNEAERLMPAIAELFEKCGHKFEELDAVLAISGPGSFTGLRIGVATANTIAYLLGCKLFAVNTFDYWHSQARAQRALITNSPSPTVPERGGHVLIFAGKGGVYLSEKGSAPLQLTLEELPQVLVSKNIHEVYGDISDEQKTILKENGVIFDEPTLTFGQTCAQLLNPELGYLSVPVSLIEPVYVKAPAITISKKNG